MIATKMNGQCNSDTNECDRDEMESDNSFNNSMIVFQMNGLHDATIESNRNAKSLIEERVKAMSYKELRSWCKSFGVFASGMKKVIT